MPASYTSEQPSNPRRHLTYWASSQWSHTILRTPCHGAWTPALLSAHPSIECSCTAPQIETPICARRTATHQLLWQQQHTCGAVADHQWNAEWADNPIRLCTLSPDTGTHPPGMTLSRRAWVRLNRLRTVVGHFRSCLYKWGMASSAACECGAEEQTVDYVSSSVQSIDLPMDYTSWGFWTMRQPNGCSTPAPKSRAAKQWIKKNSLKRKKLISKIIRENIEILFQFDLDILWKRQLRLVPPLLKVQGGNAPFSGVPAYRHQQSLSCRIICQDVCVQQTHAAKRLLWYLEVNVKRFVAMLLLHNNDQQ